MSLLTKVAFGEIITGETMSFTQIICGGCGIPFYIPTHRYNTLIQNNGSFRCPNGCERCFTGETTAEKLHKEITSLKSQQAKREQELQNQFLDELGKNMKLTKQLKRVHKGVCPCCNRTFQNLQRHMETKHPDLSAKPKTSFKDSFQKEIIKKPHRYKQ